MTCVDSLSNFRRRLFLGLALLLGANTQNLPAQTAGGPVIDPELAIKQFQYPPGFKVDLFAAEPQLANPVAFCFDEQGRVFLAETFRYKTSVYDIREHMNMFEDDLASRTVEDRAAMIKKFLGDKVKDLTVESEVVRLLEDRDGDGKADHSTVFADGFNSIVDGIGSGVLARKGKVYYTDIPNLWVLEDTNHDGKADTRTSLSYGYGVHFNFTGHDLHGLRIGPDGRLYFSIGDRGLHVKTSQGAVLDYPDTGSVLRCNLDGSDLEVFAYGLRNPQKLAFDNYGDLFTGDNNCDHGDAARLVYVVEGSDSGWRTGNQISDTTPAGVWNSEKLWYLQFPEQAAYIVPPIAHIADGPSGFTHYPGTGFPESFDDHFFLCDFRGASVNSGVHAFGVKPRGAGFEMVDHTRLFWHILATDVEFSPDGRMFVSDWIQGWDQTAKGRLYRLYDPARVNDPLVLETKKLIAEGMEHRPLAELQNLLGHPDQRVRQEAQFEMVNRVFAVGEHSHPAADGGRKYVEALLEIARKSHNQLARLHAIWGMGQLGRGLNHVTEPILPLLNDPDAEVRAQTAKVLGETYVAKAVGALTKALGDSSLRVRFFAAQSLGKLGNKDAAAPLLAMLRENADQDVFLRHAGVMGLVGTADKTALLAAGKDESRSVRMAALLVMRRLKLPDVAMFLHDTDQLIILEAARAINDVPIPEAMPQLAALAKQPTKSEPLDWRAVNANYRLGTTKCAVALADYAVQSNAPDKIRHEALHDLETWAKPSQRDRLTGLWRPLAARDGASAADALRPVAAKIIADAPETVRLAALHAVEKLSVSEPVPAVVALVSDKQVSSSIRIEALKTLAALHDSHLSEAVKLAMTDANENVRREANRLQAELKPENAAAHLATVLENGSVVEKQGAFAALAGVEGEAADKLLAEWLDRLAAGKVPKEIQFDLLEAANKRSSALVKEKLQKYLASQPKDDPFAGFRETLYGGNAEAGRKIFFERPEASCIRCHKVHGEGGDVGPELSGIITRHDREYLLESILFPNKQIAPGFESLLVQMNNGQSYAGIAKGQDDQELTLLSIEDGSIVKLKKSDIKSQVKGLSPMPEGMGAILSKEDLRNLVEFLATLK